VFLGGEEGLPGLPAQPRRLAFAAVGRRPGPAWAESTGERDATDAVGVWETLAAALGIEASVEPGDDPAFHPGRCAVVLAGGEPVGVVGEIHPSVAARFEITGRVAAGELDLDALITDPGASGFRPPSPFPPVVFDLAFDLDQRVAAGDLIRVVRASGGDLVEDVELFDVFEGGPLEEGRKSLAVRLTVRHAERTLTDEEVAPLREQIAASVAGDLGGRLRGGV
jgi:phenylalanyl-tRNA synthetase beta chain